MSSRKHANRARSIVASALTLYVAAALTCTTAQAEDGSLNDLLNDIGSSTKPESSSAQPSAEPAAPAETTDASPAAAPTDTAAEKPDASAEAPLDTIPVNLPKASAKQAESAPPSSRQIDEIVVTATKREENLREIPASISAFSGESLEKEGKVDLQDFIQETPGLVSNAQGPGAGIRVTIRGIATETGPTSPKPSPVGILIGDTSFTDPYVAGLSPDLSAFDLAGVQVLKGPQGTLFGGAALAGAIRYVLKDPVLDEWQGSAFGQYVSVTEGSTAHTEGAMLNLPWKDHGIALRLGYVKRNYPGVIDDTRAGLKDVNDGGGTQKRALLLWKPLDELSLKLTHLDQDFEGANQVAGVDFPNGPRETHSVLIPQPASNSFKLDSFEAAYDFDSVKLVSLTSNIGKKRFLLADYTPILAGVPADGYPAELAVISTNENNSKAFSQEIRLQSTDDSNFQWLVGGYFFNYSMDLEMFIGTQANKTLSDISALLAPLGLPLTGNSDPGNKTSLLYATNHAKSQEKALFFDLTQTLWDDLVLSGGARFYKTFVEGGYVGTGVLALVANNGMDVDQRSRLDEQGISPRASITYHVNDEIMLYTSASRGFRFGGLQSIPSSATNGVPPTYKSDSLWNYELGTRTTWLDNSLHMDLTGFFIKYQKPQVVQKTTDGSNLTFTTNVGAAESYGLEASMLWLPPIPGMTVSLSGGMTDAHTTVPFKAASGDIIPKGSKLPGAAKTQYSASIKQFLPLGMFLLDGSVDYTYVGTGYTDLTNTQVVNEYGVLNAGLGVSSDSMVLNPRLSVNVANILNTTAVVAGAANVKPIIPLGTYSIFGLNPPRTISLRLSLSF